MVSVNRSRLNRTCNLNLVRDLPKLLYRLGELFGTIFRSVAIFRSPMHFVALWFSWTILHVLHRDWPSLAWSWQCRAYAVYVNGNAWILVGVEKYAFIWLLSQNFALTVWSDSFLTASRYTNMICLWFSFKHLQLALYLRYVVLWKVVSLFVRWKYFIVLTYECSSIWLE